ncbi:unnamed protein product [Darwinula stevensoni]|uniref:Uncharacterized protein n=1 Tax=Darwinula stevensoni TaxID=69355 RepID=A0A7R9A6C9_9CRUS|nr:unnamed protein product [Darwinula stevensoni]CAG0888793.1 unnamed protein product [Darwinula stevensoni]
MSKLPNYLSPYPLLTSPGLIPLSPGTAAGNQLAAAAAAGQLYDIPYSAATSNAAAAAAAAAAAVSSPYANGLDPYSSIAAYLPAYSYPALHGALTPGGAGAGGTPTNVAPSLSLSHYSAAMAAAAQSPDARM